MLDSQNRACIAVTAGGGDICLLPQMANRHGLIAGATGTGKTCTLQNMAETFSRMGVPVFATDIKGDLAGVACAGGGNAGLQRSVDEHRLTERGFTYAASPVCLWDLFGKNGHPLRITISEMGPLLLSRLLDLNDIQSNVLSIAFRIADDEQLLLLDLKDFRKMLEHIGNERARYTTAYGNISTATIGAIQRGLLALEEQGADHFFGEPALDILDFLQPRDGRGVIHLLEAAPLMRAPKLYTTFLLYLLSELFERLPEVGDLERPRLVFFFDEAHLLFSGIAPVLLEKVEQVVRLIRSKGVGIYFCTQNPTDIPDTVLGQLGNRVQHALRAFTPRDQKTVVTAAATFRPNPAFDARTVISELGIGEALVSFLDASGRPTVVERAAIIPPEGRAGALTADERRATIQASPFFGKYDQAVDRESAFEFLTARMERTNRERDDALREKEEQRQQKEQERRERAERVERERLERQRQREKDSSLTGSLTKMASTKAKREVVNLIFKFGRGLLGSLLK